MQVGRAHLVGVSIDETQVWTVTVAGTERYDGHEPWVYCVTASSLRAAQSHVLDHHRREQQDVDLQIVREGCFAGAPGPGVWYAWNDLRPRTPRTEYPSVEAVLAHRVRPWTIERELIEHGERAGDQASNLRRSDRDAATLLFELADLVDNARVRADLGIAEAGSRRLYGFDRPRDHTGPASRRHTRPDREGP